jgi:membrane protein DedA with SNARE-associated domain
MDKLGGLFEEYGLPLVFCAVFLEQLGPPIPSGLLLIVAGALAKEGRVSVLSVAGVAWVACMLGKIALYVVGGHYGKRAMSALCRFSISPVTAIGKADGKFERWGAALLLFAEFIPGVRTLAPTVAGAEKLGPTPFLVYSALGAALWTGLYLGIGFAFRKQIDRGLALVEQSGEIAIAVIGTALAVYFVIRLWRRRRSLKPTGTSS